MEVRHCVFGYVYDHPPKSKHSQYPPDPVLSGWRYAVGTKQERFLHCISEEAIRKADTQSDE